VSVSATGLSPLTIYYFRVDAANAGGSSNGSIESFTTPPDPPTVVTEAASAVGQTSATLNGLVNPNSATVSECKLEYGTSTSYGSSAMCTPAPGSGSGPVSVSAAIGGLSERTTYHFRVVATNAGGTSYGSDLTFMTETSMLAEYGQCVAQKKGEYTSGDCQTRSAKAHKGHYEWKPGPAATCVAQKKGEYTNSSCTTKSAKARKGTFEKEAGPGYTTTIGAVTLATPGLSGSKVVCAAGTAVGEVTGLKAGTERMTFTGCEASGKKCSSEGPDSTPSGKAGVIVTNLLDTSLIGPVNGAVWTQLDSAEHGPYALEFGCEGSLLRTMGALAGVQTGNVNVSSLASATTFASGEAEQGFDSELSEDGGTVWTGPDSTSAVLTATNTAAAATEIKT